MQLEENTLCQPIIKKLPVGIIGHKFMKMPI